MDNRQYVGGDKMLEPHLPLRGLATRPELGRTSTSTTPGALITYWDSSYFDNNVGDHPGHGELLPVDATPSSTTT